MKDLRALQFISSFCVLKREAVVSAGFCRSRIKINVLGPATGNVSYFAEGSDDLDLINMLSSACFVHTLYNHHLLRERRLFHAPKHIHFVCRTFVSSVDQEFSTVNLWVGAGVRCDWIPKSESCHWQMLGCD